MKDIERLASVAEGVADYWDESAPYDHCPNMRVNNWPEIARALLQELRNPSEGAWEAWRSVNCKNGEPCHEFTNFNGDYGNWLACHQKMIDHMLSEAE